MVLTDPSTLILQRTKSKWRIDERGKQRDISYIS